MRRQRPPARTISGPLPVAYLSVDVETDGPVPGLYSMLSIGLAAFDAATGAVVYEREHNLLPLPDAQQDPVTMRWWGKPEQRKAWNHLLSNRQEPSVAFQRLAAELRALRQRYRLFVIAWPACFDWMFLHWYMHRFVGDNPLGRSAKCAVTYAWAVARTTTPNVDISSLLEQWEDDRFVHTHCALDDAREQGAKFINMLRDTIQHGQDARV